MSFNPTEQAQATVSVFRWSVLAALVGALAGMSSAAFLLSLDWATDWRDTHLWIIGLLPLGGLAIGLFYLWFGKSVEAGNNLVLDEIHEQKATLPLRMTPVILLATVASHLFGGSVGREGTAVQMGASLADQVTRLFRLGRHDRRILLMAGISGGFGAVFGTPIAGAVFGLEVLALGGIRFDALFPCLIAAVVGDRVTVALGVHHTHYLVGMAPDLSLGGFGSALAVGAGCGILAMIFVSLTHGISASVKRAIAWMPMRLVVGGAIITIAVLIIGNTRHIGLGIPVMVESFQHQVPVSDFILKLALTAITLGFGFKGGEVTPLFFIGATFGSALAGILPLPVDVLAAIGFVALFAGAANTPLACIVMAFELFGSQIGVYAGLACVASYHFSGHTGIYRSQRIAQPKHAIDPMDHGMTIGEIPAVRRRTASAVLSLIHPFGLLGRTPQEGTVATLAALRIFCHHHQQVPRTGLRRFLFAADLNVVIARRAKRSAIQQVVVHRVRAGYLPGQPLAVFDGETPPRSLPACVELIDTEANLRRFIRHYRKLLTPTRMVMLHCTELTLEKTPAVTGPTPENNQA